MNKQQVRDYLRENYGEENNAYKMFEEILEQYRGTGAYVLWLNEVEKAVGWEVAKGLIENVFSKEPLSLVKIQWCYLLEDETHMELTDEDLEYFQQEGEIINPETGEEGDRENMFKEIQLTERFRSILKEVDPDSVSYWCPYCKGLNKSFNELAGKRMEIECWSCGKTFWIKW